MAAEEGDGGGCVVDLEVVRYLVEIARRVDLLVFVKVGFVRAVVGALLTPVYPGSYYS